MHPVIFSRPPPVVPVYAQHGESQSFHQPPFELRSAALDVYPFAFYVVVWSVELNDNFLVVVFIIYLDVDVEHGGGGEVYFAALKRRNLGRGGRRVSKNNYKGDFGGSPPTQF